MSSWKLNTSNLGKFEEFKRLFAQYGEALEATHIDLEEIEADPIKVIAHKASQMAENTIVDDSSLEVEGLSIGVNVRWLLDHLPGYVGHKAEWTSLLAFRRDDQIFIYKGSVLGSIVKPRGKSGFGFDPVFLPNGAIETLAESKPDAYNARAKAVEALMQDHEWIIHPVIDDWQGPWQNSH